MDANCGCWTNLAGPPLCQPGEIQIGIVSEDGHSPRQQIITHFGRDDHAAGQGGLQQAKANLVLAKSKFDRATDLAKSNFISGQAKDEAENNLKVAEAVLSLAEAKLAKTEINAPFAGIIGLRVVSLGDYVKEGADMVNRPAIAPPGN